MATLTAALAEAYASAPPSPVIPRTINVIRP
jgi:hypothetical protein